MSAQPKANEPSMEEILASIRKIISDDQSKAPAAAVEQPAVVPAPAQVPQPLAVVAPSVRPAPDDDILDLGNEALSLEDTTKADIHVLSEPAAVLLESPVEKSAFVPQDENAAMMTVSHASEVDMSSLLSNQASSSISNAFGSLAHTVLSQNARTVDDLVKEMLKPLLKGWLDDNLPTLVERLVRAEIERVARGGRG